ncbi:MAG: cytochrome c [Chloroflexi bacterium]|nr:cytochrome c [Chloroflexota bacterium]
MASAGRARMLSAIGLCVSFAALIVACGNRAAAPPSVSAPTEGAAPSVAQSPVANGKNLFESHCAVCHGQLGEGGKAPDGSIATPLSAHLRAHAGLEGEDEHVISAVLDGIHHEEDGSTRVLGDAMPRFRGKLSESEVTDIISYMQTLP